MLRKIRMRWLLFVGALFTLGACGSEPLATLAPRTRAIVFLGHSNGQGHNADPNGSNDPPDGAVRDDVLLLRRALLPNEAFYDRGLVPLGPTTVATGSYHGAELALGLFLSENTSDHVAFLKITANGSALVDWAEGGAHHDELGASLTDFARAIGERFQDSPVDWSLVVFQGTREASAAHSSNAAVLEMPQVFANVHSDVDAWIGQETAPLVVLEPSAIENQPFLVSERTTQRAMADAEGGQALDPDAVIGLTEMQSDGRHWNAPGHNALGRELLGPILLSGHP